jgi:hypothetical protein
VTKRKTEQLRDTGRVIFQDTEKHLELKVQILGKNEKNIIN